jgi:hypothetical protein
MTTTGTTSAPTIHQGDHVLYHGSITKMHGLGFTVTNTAGGTLTLKSGNIFIGEILLQGVHLESVTKI